MVEELAEEGEELIEAVGVAGVCGLCAQDVGDFARGFERLAGWSCGGTAGNVSEMGVIGLTPGRMGGIGAETCDWAEDEFGAGGRGGAYCCYGGGMEGLGGGMGGMGLGEGTWM